MADQEEMTPEEESPEPAEAVLTEEAEPASAESRAEAAEGEASEAEMPDVEMAEAEGAEAEPEQFTPASPVRTINPPANQNIPDLKPGDDVSVHVLIKEGDRERVQEFRGTVIRMRNGGTNASFTVRRVAAHGIGVERTFLMRSPLIDKVEIQRRAHVRRAKLYYLRDRTGKRARLKEKREGQE